MKKQLFLWLMYLSMCHSFAQGVPPVTLLGQPNTFLNGTYNFHSCTNEKNIFRLPINTNAFYNGNLYFSINYSEIRFNNNAWELSFIHGIQNNRVVVSTLASPILTSPVPPCGSAFGATLSSNNGSCYESTCTTPDFPEVVQNHTKCSAETLKIPASCPVGSIAQWFKCTSGLCLSDTPNSCSVPYASDTLVTSAEITTYYKVACKNSCGMQNFSVVTVNVIQSPAPPAPIAPLFQNICSNETITLTSSCGSNTVRWYEQNSMIGTGDSFTTQPLTVSTYFRARCFDGTCESAFSQDTSKVNIATPLPPTLEHDTVVVCLDKLYTISATCPSGYQQWFDAPIGGNFITSGPLYTGVITGSKIYYAGCNNDICISTVRTKLTLLILSAPTGVPANQNFCRGDIVSLSAHCPAPGSVVNWYTGSLKLHTGGLFQFRADTTIQITARCSNDSCQSEAIITNVNVPEFIDYMFVDDNPANEAILTYHGCPTGEVIWKIHKLTQYDLMISPEASGSFIDSVAGNPGRATLKGFFYIKASCSTTDCGPKSMHLNNCQPSAHNITSPNYDYTSGVHITHASYYGDPTINANNKITGTARTYYTGNSITLSPGFEAVSQPSGAIFVAMPGTCDY